MKRIVDKKLWKTASVVAGIIYSAAILWVLTGCGPNRYMLPENTFYVKIDNSPGAVVVLPFWSGDFPSTEKYDTSQQPQFSAEIPLIPKAFPNPRGLFDAMPPDTDTFVVIWTAKKKTSFPEPLQQQKEESAHNGK